MSELDDWVDAARAGGGWAFARLWCEFAGPVSGYLRARGVIDVEDVTSDVFLSAFKSLGAFDGDGVSFRSWLFTIAHRRSVDEHRRIARRDIAVEVRSAMISDRAPSAETLAVGDQQVRELLATLPSAQREVIWLRFVEDLSLEDVARITGRGVGAVKQLQRRGIARLHRHLNSPTPERPIPPATLVPIAELR